ncbi:MAG: rod-binding protein [Pirellulaceae bacterium]|nr:rod-binding protein [Pirellulaceae bacterium]
MEITSNPPKLATSDLLTRQLTAQSGAAQTAASFLSQLEGPLESSTSLLSADGLPTNGMPAETPEIRSPLNPSAASPELREAFEDFVGQTFFSEMIKACRTSQKPSAYFNGGRAEEIFQGQLDQVLSEELSKSSADKIADPMFELFMLKRQA